MSGAYTHRPVLLEEAIQGLAIRPDGVYVDGTLGRGGHSEAIVRGLTAGGRLLCIDRDSQALEEGRARLAPWAGQITFLHGNFGDLAALLDGAGVERVDGMLFDLGVSSPQLDDPARGFSYQADAPLDMRMDQGETLTAWTVVNQWPRQELRRVLAQYGEERYAAAIAAFDGWLAGFLPHLGADDVLMITADHGCDPATPSTDHSREYIPLLVYGEKIAPVPLGTRKSFADIGKTVLELLGADGPLAGESFAGMLRKV